MAATATATPINLLLAWTDNSRNGLGFSIERAASPRGPWTLAGVSMRGRPEFLDTNLRGATTYYYRVQTFSDEGVSDYSNVAKITTPSRAQPPRIRKQPDPRTVSLGDDTILGAAFGGNPPLQFQWRHNGTNLPGATSQQLSLTSVAPHDAGDYSLVVSNDIGMTVSKPVKLVVVAPLAISTSGGGSIVSLSSGQKLELGRNYKMGAVARKGNAFLGWRINGSNGPLSRTMSFTMQAGLEVSASFRDATAPTVTPRNLKSGAKLNTPQFTLTGTAVDNMGVTRVSYQINNGPWLHANGSANWQAQVWLKSGANLVRVFARDEAGNNSRTNAFAITSLATGSIGEILPPVVTSLRLSNGTAMVSFQSIAGVLYGLECQNSPFGAEWLPVEGSWMFGHGNSISLMDSSVSPYQRFYRVVVSVH